MKPPCKLIGENGNVFNLLAITRRTLKRHGLLQELDEFDSKLNELTANGGRYDDVLNLIADYVAVE